MVIWYIFPRFGILYQEKSGNPVLKDQKTVLFFCANQLDQFFLATDRVLEI
jgi:hypothetical protein